MKILVQKKIEAAVEINDFLKEAFRTDPGGNPALLEECKAILRAYLQHISAGS